jgi:RNA polymerase sigma-70 factor (ECF subfamily)
MTATLDILQAQPTNSSAGFASSETGARASPDVESLTRQMKAGDETAYRIFYDAYFDRLWRYLVVVAAGNEDAAREALQTALLRVARHVRIIRDEKVFWSWLTVLARSAYADETRKRRRYFSFLDRFRQYSGDNIPGHGVEGDGRLQGLLKIQMTRLPPDEQQLIGQKYFEGCSVRDIAANLQTTEKAVESKLSRIRRKLKDAVLAKLNHESRD